MLKRVGYPPVGELQEKTVACVHTLCAGETGRNGRDGGSACVGTGWRGYRRHGRGHSGNQGRSNASLSRKSCGKTTAVCASDGGAPAGKIDGELLRKYCSLCQAG